MDLEAIFNTITSQIYHWASNFHRNLFHMFDDMNTTRYIRLIACVGAYLLIRPYFVKIGEKIQEKEMEKQGKDKAKDPYEAATKGKMGKKEITPNALRGGKVEKGKGEKTVTFEDSEGDSGVEEGDVKWGSKAKAKQRKAMEAKEEKLREDDEEDKDIMDLLEDYEPGKDGW